MTLYCHRSNVHQAVGIHDLKRRSDQVSLESLMEFVSTESSEVSKKDFTRSASAFYLILADQRCKERKSGKDPEKTLRAWWWSQ